MDKSSGLDFVLAGSKFNFYLSVKNFPPGGGTVPAAGGGDWSSWLGPSIDPNERQTAVMGHQRVLEQVFYVRPYKEENP